MKNIRIMTCEEFEKVFSNPKTKAFITRICMINEAKGYDPTFWLMHGKIANGYGVASAKVPLSATYCVVPVLYCPAGPFTPGELFTFGTDINKLPLRWAAVSDNLLVSMEFSDVIQATGIPYCSGGKDTWDVSTPDERSYEKSDVAKFIMEFSYSAFTVSELRKIIDGTFYDLLVPYDGTLVIPNDVTTIPAYRYSENQDITKLVVSPREQHLSIERWAFGASAIAKVEGLDNCSIQARAFYGCLLEGTLSLGNIQNIGGKAFGSNNIEKITINGIVDTISTNAFDRNQISEVECTGNILEIRQGAFAHNHLTKDMIGKIVDKVLLGYDELAFTDQEIGG